MRKLLPPLLVALALLALPPVAGADLPSRLIGIAPQNAVDASDLELMQESGVHSARLPLNWISVQSENPTVAEPDFSGFDRVVGLAAEQRIRIFPFVSASPAWAASEPTVLPVASAWQRWGWETFLRDAVERYGPEGSFWEENPDLPFMPIRSWEIWNEENIVTFAQHPDPVAFAKLMRLSGRVKPADPVRVLVEFKGGDGRWRRVRVLRARVSGTNFSASLRLRRPGLYRLTARTAGPGEHVRDAPLLVRVVRSG